MQRNPKPAGDAAIRSAAVAGSFYPADPGVLSATISHLLKYAQPPPLQVDIRILVVPHAGLVYSGPVAAVGYASLSESSLTSPVGLVGPSHFVPVDGPVTPPARVLSTPLGNVAVDSGLRAAVEALPCVRKDASSHAGEHSLEIQLPFLQVTQPEPSVLPVLTGEDPAEAAEVIEVLVDQGSLVIISSDLSHYLPYRDARRHDARTAQAIVDLEPGRLGWSDACGRIGIQGALECARRRGWRCQLLDLRNSGDTAGGHGQVVGYGSFAIGPGI